ncbi:hypothetical protein I204_04254 [Kwoniella mangroviensis CBS 8886]|nr:hypothetical protein I204_04254 [Kwoniella mangroviensis CBS 8886]
MSSTQSYSVSVDVPPLSNVLEELSKHTLKSTEIRRFPNTGTCRIHFEPISLDTTAIIESKDDDMAFCKEVPTKFDFIGRTIMTPNSGTTRMSLSSSSGAYIPLGYDEISLFFHFTKDSICFLSELEPMYVNLQQHEMVLYTKKKVPSLSTSTLSFTQGRRILVPKTNKLTVQSGKGGMEGAVNDAFAGWLKTLTCELLEGPTVPVNLNNTKLMIALRNLAFTKCNEEGASKSLGWTTGNISEGKR